MMAVRSRSFWWAAVAALALGGVGCDPGGTPASTCTTSSDCRGGLQCRDGRCVVPPGTDGGPDANRPGFDAGAPDAFVELPTDAGMIDMPDTSMGWSATDDSDGDTIGDLNEGRATGEDTDVLPQDVRSLPSVESLTETGSRQTPI